MTLSNVFNDLRKVKSTLYNDSKYALELAVQLKKGDISGFNDDESLINELVELLTSINSIIHR